MSKVSPLYEHLNPDKKEIRLFELHSAPTGAVVKVRLFKRLLTEAIEEGFITLSYVWGDPLDVESIQVNGTSRCITKNLAALLKHIRNEVAPDFSELSSAYKGKAQFWADALCIDQGNIKERESQVSLMRDIYGSAGLSVSWLGCIENAHLAVELCNAFSDWHAPEGVLEDHAIIWENGCHPNHGDWMSKYPNLWSKDCDSGCGNSYWNAMDELMQSPYWKRVWCFQEIVTPKKLVLLAGENKLHLKQLIRIGDWTTNVIKYGKTYFPMIEEGLLRIFLACELPKTFRLNVIRYAIRARDKGSRKKISEITALDDLEATDARDKIFGFLGVLDTRIMADYHRTTEEVYQSFCITWWSEIGNLNFLNDAGLSRKSKHSDMQLPSWVVDWRVQKRKIPMRAMFNPNYPLSVSFGSKTAKVRFDESASRLEASGIIFDQVEDAMYPQETPDRFLLLYTIFKRMAFWQCQNETRPSSSAPHIFRSVFYALSLGLNPINPGEELNINSMKTHTLAIMFLYFLMPGNLQRMTDTTLAQHLSKIGLATGPDFARTYKDNFFPDAQQIPQLPEWSTARTALELEWNDDTIRRNLLQNNIETRLGDKTSVFTKNGYFGLSNGAQKGDHLAIIAGCDAPVILRKQTDRTTYELVSTCYMHGAMKGEVFEMYGEPSVEMIEIC